MTIQVTRKDGTKFTVPTAKSKKRSSKKPSQAAMSRSLTTTQKAEVLNLVKKTNETKYVCEDTITPGGFNALTNYVAFSSAVTNISEIYAALPQLTQGVDSYQRIGDQIAPSSCYITMNIAVKNGPSDAFSTDKTVHVFLMTSVAVKDLANYSAIPIGQMLDQGNGTSGGFDGTSGAAMRPVQRKNFTVLKHWQKRMTSGFGHPIGSTGTTAGNADSVITPAASFASLRLKVRTPKVLKYALASSTFPNNYAPFFVVGWTRNDSAGNSAPSFINTYVQAKTHMRFKDS